MFLERIQTPADLKSLSSAELNTLCGELRQYMVEHVALTGGHLSSNLGVVELTVAIHRVFDTSRDRLVFDVGHQCYVHKLLTQRRESFSTLRQSGGISGFPKPDESIHDAFVAGHASTAVSVALGMARCRTLAHEPYHVLALVGDASFAGGMNLEAISDAGSSGEPLIVILNDNGMSISRSVGGLSGYLSSLRAKPRYNAFKARYRRMLSTSATGQKFHSLGHHVKLAIKEGLLPGSTVFENLGFTYLGPVDGHDVTKLINALEQAKRLKAPVLLHVHTVKGMGYTPAQENPSRFHGVGSFDAATGTVPESSINYSDVFGESLCTLAQEDKRICAVTAAMPTGTGLDSFAARYPERFFDVGIAEEHAVSMAAGMAKQGAIPVFAVYSSFLQRGFDQLLQDVSLQRLHVVFAVDRAGLVGADGETHHGCFDTGYLTQIPGMTVFTPASFDQLRQMLRVAVYETEGPVAIRYPRGNMQADQTPFAKTPLAVLREGNDGVLISYGAMLQSTLDAADLLSRKGIRMRVVALRRIAPLPERELLSLSEGAPFLAVVEDSMAHSAIGERIAAALLTGGTVPKQYRLFNLGDRVPSHGSVSSLLTACGLDAPSLAKAVEEALS